MISGQELLAALPVPVYTTDGEGWVTGYNDAAAELWGLRPPLGTTRWCGSTRAFCADGRPIAPEDSPLARSLREERPIRGMEVLIERPDGARVSIMPFPSLLRDDDGRLIGAVSLLLDLSERKRAELDLARLAAIVATSDDAIVSKTLEGRIVTWNAAAARLFGYPPEEAVGRPITMIIPPELHSEEEQILARLQRGERIDHFDTVRITKDGRRIDVSLTVSPLRDGSGRVVGASKIARDVSERKQHEALQRLLFDELNHRVKNTLATVQAIAGQSLRRSANPEEFVAGFTGRIQALSRAHDLLVRGRMQGADVMEIVRDQVVLGTPDVGRIFCSGPFLLLDSRAAVQLSLVLHELATNARKYGALSVADGRLALAWEVRTEPERTLRLEWRESGVPEVREPRHQGFGTLLIERSLHGNGGSAPIVFGPDGIVCTISIPLPEEGTVGQTLRGMRKVPERPPSADPVPSRLEGRRILVVEDEPLIALEVEALLAGFGCIVVGPAETVEAAERLIGEVSIDAALLDANLGGYPVDRLIAVLQRIKVPFAFATGYGREALPSGIGDAPVLTKPFAAAELRTALASILPAQAAARRPTAAES